MRILVQPFDRFRRGCRIAATVLTLTVLVGCSEGAGTKSTASLEAFCATVTEVELSGAGYRRLTEVTPESLRADVERLASTLDGLETSSGTGDAPDDLALDPADQAALQRIGNYVTEKCGIGGSEPASEAEARNDSATTPAPPEPPEATTHTSRPSDSRDGGSAPDDDNSDSRREEAAVPPEEVKAEIRAIFRDRLWGTTHGYFAPDGSEYEGQVSELTEDEALSACEDLSTFIAEHPHMEGQGVLRLTDITVNSDNEVVTNPVALNETIGAGDPGSCRTAD